MILEVDPSLANSPQEDEKSALITGQCAVTSQLLGLSPELNWNGAHTEGEAYAGDP